MKMAISRNTFNFLASLYFVCFLNIPFWSEIFKIIKASNTCDLLYVLSMFICLSAVFTVVFNLILLPHIQKTVVTILSLIAIFATYNMYYFKVVISAEMIQNVFETDIHEATDLFSAKFGTWALLLGAPLFSLFFFNISNKTEVLSEIKSRLKAIIMAAFLIIIAAGISYKTIVVIHRNHRNLISLVTPINCFFYVGKFIKKHNAAPPTFTKIGQDAVKGTQWKNVTKKTVVVIVVGEAARSGNFSLNGYARETNPLLKKKNVISLRNVSACATSTAEAVPGIFSRLPRKNYTPEKAAQEENLLDVLSRIGFSIFWRDNNSSSKGVASRFKEENIRHLNQNDEALLNGLEDYVKNIKTDSIIVLHQLGSHGPAYYKRYPKEFDKFRPGCNTNEIQSCKTPELVNTYDNTILYTDYILAKVIDLLEKNENLNTAMIYVSDHGQSLGEFGIYLHGTPYMIAPKEQIHIPWIMWFSKNFSKEFSIDEKNLRAKEKAEYSHDNFFHSMLGLLGIETQEYQKNLDIFKKEP